MPRVRDLWCSLESTAMGVRRIKAPVPLDLQRTLGFHTAGRSDPSFHFGSDSVWMAMRNPEGPAVVRFIQDGTEVTSEAFGPGRTWAQEHAPDFVGANDDPSGFRPHHPAIADLMKRFKGVRITRSGLVAEMAVRTVVAQKVTGKEAKSSYARLTRAFGDPAPGPQPLVLPPDPGAIGRAAYTKFHPLGVERRRAETLIRIGRHHRRLQEATQMDLADAYRRIKAVQGIGDWTAAKIGLTALGDPDAVPVADYHLANVVSWVLAGEPRGDDDRMLELLEPYRGHRGRVIRLVQAAGIHAPKFGPRQTIRSIETI